MTKPTCIADLIPALLLTLLASGCLVEMTDAGNDDVGSTAASAHYLVISNDTILKAQPVQSSTLAWNTGKCRLLAGTRVTSTTAPAAIGDHFLIDMTTSIPGCQFTRGYVWMGHVSDVSDSATADDTPQPTAGGCQAAISVRQCALLSTVAYAEGTNARYDLIFSYGTFSSYADHPRRVLCSSGYCSDAAGRYQFLSTTWDWVRSKLGLTSFSPANQDRAALWLMSYRGVTNIDSIDTYDELATALYRLNNEWASLPGSPYGQPTHSASELWSQYRRFAGL